MAQFFGLVRYEFKMSICRRGLWIAYAGLFILYAMVVFAPTLVSERATADVILPSNVWQFAGEYAINFNIFIPVAVGILSADRIYRDQNLCMWELQNSTPLKTATYVSTKFLGVFGSLWIPVFIWQIITGIGMAALGMAPWTMAYALPAAGFVISLPAFAFVIAFSLLFPLILPLRIYQILFTGYWFWANFIPAESFPTLNGTLVTPAGFFAYEGFFGGFHGNDPSMLKYDSQDAVLNIAVIFTLAAAALLVSKIILKRKLQKV